MKLLLCLLIVCFLVSESYGGVWCPSRRKLDTRHEEMSCVEECNDPKECFSESEVGEIRTETDEDAEEEIKFESEEDILTFVNISELELEKAMKNTMFALWDFATNITDESQAASLEAREAYMTLAKQIGEVVRTFDMTDVEDKIFKRKVEFLSELGTSVLPEEQIREFNQLVADMGSVYSTAKVKEYYNRTEDFSLEPELTLEMAKYGNPEVLEYYWTEWREQTGRKIREMYMDYVKLNNKAAELNNYKDASDMWVVTYESDSFKQEMEAAWMELKPLYEQLHAYARTKLNKLYGPKHVPKTGPLPAHLLGNMRAMQWNNLADVLIPYPNKPTINVTGEMLRNGWDEMMMFEKADEFFQSMGMEPVPPEFWSDSLLKKPDDGRDLVCHASAWDFQNQKDFRIKQCTRVNQEDLYVVNHEMGHIQYFLQYKEQPFLFRNSPNPGFHEGVADVVSLAMGTASYLQDIGLVTQDIDIEDEETNLNILMDMALSRVAFLPFGYLVDKFRWDVFSGVTSLDNMNCHWWKLRHEIQGVKPPKIRTYRDFDPGAMFHVANDVGYIRYFTAFIYQFQFYRAMCQVSGQYVPDDPKKPLHRCNFYGSTEAGDKLSEMTRLGASRPGSETLEVMTGQPDLSTAAIREYFRPLEEWLRRENAKNGAKVGWGKLDLNSVCLQDADY